MPAMQRQKGVVYRARLVALCKLRIPGLGYGGNDLSGHSETVADVVSGHVVGH